MALLAACAPNPVVSATGTPTMAPSSVEAPTASASPSEAPELPMAVSCSELAASLPLEQRIGQLFMVGVSTTGLGSSARSAIEDSQVGFVVLLGDSGVSVSAVADLTDEIAGLAPDGLPIVVAADQEGGQVQRLAGQGFSEIPSALEQAEMEETELHSMAAGWGQELAEAGVTYNLAPVADLVSAANQERNAPIGELERNYGNDLTITETSVAAFVGGMSEVGIATSVKHFPGLGSVGTNTDFGVATDDTIGNGDSSWRAFQSGIDAGVSSVMISSAIYEKIDPENQAVFSSIIIEDILRTELGYDGVVISDDLGAAASVAEIPAGERATRFIAAGGDIVINADPTIQEDMSEAVVDKAEADPEFEEMITASAGRVLGLKSELGQVSCNQ